MSQDVRNSKPTCSTCPFFARSKAGSIGDMGSCLYARAVPVAMGGNPQTGLMVGGMRPPARHDETCNDHPRMAAWLAKHYPRPLVGGVDMASGVDWTTVRIGKSPERPGRDDDRETEPDIHAHDEPDAREREAEQEQERDKDDDADLSAYDQHDAYNEADLTREMPESRGLKRHDATKSPIIIAGTLGGTRST